jgi:hypothetical protein
MQKVYVLTELDYSLDTNVLGVFSSEEASILAREQYLEKEPYQHGVYRRILLGLF